MIQWIFPVCTLSVWRYVLRVLHVSCRSPCSLWSRMKKTEGKRESAFFGGALFFFFLQSYGLRDDVARRPWHQLFVPESCCSPRAFRLTLLACVCVLSPLHLCPRSLSSSLALSLPLSLSLSLPLSLSLSLSRIKPSASPSLSALRSSKVKAVLAEKQITAMLGEWTTDGAWGFSLYYFHDTKLGVYFLSRL